MKKVERGAFYYGGFGGSRGLGIVHVSWVWAQATPFTSMGLRSELVV